MHVEGLNTNGVTRASSVFLERNFVCYTLILADKVRRLCCADHTFKLMAPDNVYQGYHTLQIAGRFCFPKRSIVPQPMHTVEGWARLYSGGQSAGPMPSTERRSQEKGLLRACAEACCGGKQAAQPTSRYTIVNYVQECTTRIMMHN
jgi:hypothetical protein